MAERSISGQFWPEGTTVAVYPAASWVEKSRAPAGASLTAAVVVNGTVSFGGLAENTRYVAYAAGVGITFLIAQSGLSDPVAKTDRERLKLLELGASNPDVTALVRSCLWDGIDWTFAGEAITARPDVDGVLFWMGGGSEQDPTPEGLGIAAPYDVWYPTVVA